MRLVLLTPRGPGGVAVVRVEGDDRIARLLPYLRHQSGRALTRDGLCRDRPLLLQLVVDGEEVDEVLFVDLEHLRRSEIHLHGSGVVLSRIERVLGPLESPGDLSAADELLLRSGSEAQLALALEQRHRGDFAEWSAAVASLPWSRRRAEVEAALRRTRIAWALSSPRRVVLFGPQNAGKSTLFNRLVLGERVLTAATPGSTRDAVHESTFLDGYPYELVDTAGEGEASGEIDRIAQERGRALRVDSIRLLVCDSSLPRTAMDSRLLLAADLVVANKQDLPQAAGWAEDAATIAVSSVDPLQAPAIRARVGTALRQLRRLDPVPSCGVGGVAAMDDAERASLSVLAQACGVDGATQHPAR